MDALSSYTDTSCNMFHWGCIEDMLAAEAAVREEPCSSTTPLSSNDMLPLESCRLIKPTVSGWTEIKQPLFWHSAKRNQQHMQPSLCNNNLRKCLDGTYLHKEASPLMTVLPAVTETPACSYFTSFTTWWYRMGSPCARAFTSLKLQPAKCDCTIRQACTEGKGPVTQMQPVAS